MSLVAITSPLAALNPKVWTEDGRRLFARTNLFLQILCLFFWEKSVAIDRDERTVAVRRRFFWLIERTTVYRFEDISHILYKYRSVSLGWDMFGRDTDRAEAFDVGFELEATDSLGRRDEILLFAFRGDGHGMTGVSGVLLGDSAIDTGGDQADASLSYVDLIQNYTGKTLSRPRGYMAARYR